MLLDPEPSQFCEEHLGPFGSNPDASLLSITRAINVTFPPGQQGDLFFTLETINALQSLNLTSGLNDASLQYQLLIN